MIVIMDVITWNIILSRTWTVIVYIPALAALSKKKISTVTAAVPYFAMYFV